MCCCCYANKKNFIFYFSLSDLPKNLLIQPGFVVWNLFTGMNMERGRVGDEWVHFGESNWGFVLYVLVVVDENAAYALFNVLENVIKL